MKITPVLVIFFITFAFFLRAEESEKGVQDDLSRKVEKKILDKDKIKIDNLQVLNRDGTIYLEGVAKVLGSRVEAEEIAMNVDGVKNVENQIAVSTKDVSNLEIQTELIRRIRSRMRGNPFDLVQIKVSNGFVTLLGVVRDTTLKKEAYEEAIWIPGVRGVENQIRLATIGAQDERLRRIIHRRLAAEYPLYFAGSDPSIIILVESARVTLVGSVNSRVDRERIGTIVRSIQGILTVNNQLESS